MRRYRQWLRRLRRQAGQATVEYVGLAVAVAVLLTAVGGGLASHGESLSKAMAKRITDTVKTQAK